MAERVQTFAVQVPANTLKSAPQFTSLDVPDGTVTTVEIDVPPGPRGLMGFAIEHSQRQQLPEVDGSYFVYDNVHKAWPLHRFPTGNKWRVRAYNTDLYPHTVYLTFLLDELRPVPSGPVVLQPVG